MLPLLLLSLTGVPGAASAQDEAPREPELAPGTELRFDPRTELDMDELDVRGAIRGPSSASVWTAQPKDGPPLIRLRGDFDAEMAESVGLIR